MRKIFIRFNIVVVILLCSFGHSFSQTAVNGSASYRATVPAKGSHTLIMPVTRWGRYALQTTGNDPVALSIADKRNGVFRRDGDAGQRNARIDLFLDLGEYKLQVQGIKTAVDSATVTATPFSYPLDFTPQYLVPLRENKLTLKDLQQATYWFETFSDTTIYIEAVGRNLEDMRLWRDGEWMVETENRSFTSRPKPETPLKGIVMVARVPKGNYMVGVYGGKGISWATESTDNPLYLQGGIETLPVNVALNQVIPPKGYIQMLLGSGVNTLVVEGADKKRLSVDVNRLTDKYAANEWVASDSIHSKSASNRLALNVGSSNNALRLVKVTGTPGQCFVFQTIGASNPSIDARVANSFWVSSLHTGDYKDQIGASGVVVDMNSGNAIVAVSADTITLDRDLARRFNLLEEINMFVWVDADGKYSVTTGGSDFSWRIYRYFYSPPENFSYPNFQDKSGTVELSRGLYRMELQPIKKGIASVIISKASLMGGLISAGKNLLGSSDEKRQWNMPRPAVQFSRISIAGTGAYRAVVNSQSPELSAISVRPLPIDPDVPLTIWCKTNAAIQIPLKLKGQRIVTVKDEHNIPNTFDIDGKKYDKSAELAAGSYILTVNGGSQDLRRLILKTILLERNPTVPAPPFPDEKRDALPKFPVIAAGHSVSLDLDRQSNQMYTIEVTEPALYRIETTGRLATQLLLRDRFGNFTRSAQQNGVGRNAMLILYLLAGQYQVAISTAEQSTGHLGVAVYRNPLLDGGVVERDIDNRTMVSSFTGVGYTINIPSNGTYRIESMGQNGDFPIRLEDAAGWPFDPAENSNPYQLTLDAGQYKLISLPNDQEGRRIARISSIVESRKLKGKGPHELEINTTISSTWVDNQKKNDPKGNDLPVVFTFTLPAQISAQLVISSGFTASLFKGGNDTAMFSWSGKRKESLAMGNYSLLVKPKLKSNFAPFQVSVTTSDLVAGLSYELNRSKTIGVNVGTASVVEFVSQGTLDVSAKLLDEKASTVIALNDDSYMDWNFGISRMLKPGRYYLKVESAEGDFTSTRVFMRSLTDTLMDSLSTSAKEPVSIQCNLNRHIGVFPISQSDTGDIIACAVQGKSRIGCSIERLDSEEWVLVAQTHGTSSSLSIPSKKNAQYRIRVWSEDNMAESVSLAYSSISAKLVSWKNALDGLSGQTQSIGNENCAWVKVDLGNEAPGHFRVEASHNSLNGIAVSESIDTAFLNESPDWFSSSQQYAWVELHFEHQGRFQVKVTPMILENAQSFNIGLTGNRPRVFQTKQDERSVAVLTVETDGYHPLAGILRQSSNGPPAFTIRGLVVDQSVWIGDSKCATVSLPSDQHKIVVWNSLSPNDGSQPSAKISWTVLPLTDAGLQSTGVSNWSVTSPSARMTHLAKGTKVRLRITMPPSGAVIVTRSNGSRLLAYSSGDESTVKEFVTDGGELYLLGLKNGASFDVATFVVSSGDAVNLDNVLVQGKNWELRMQHEGTQIVPLSVNATKDKLYYRGAIRSIDWIAQDGILHSEIKDGTSVSSGGLLMVDHTEGWVKLDLCDGDSSGDVMSCKWGASLVPTDVTPIKQSSQFKLNNRINWFSFEVSDTQHVNLSAPSPLAAILFRDGKPVNYQEAWDLFNWDLPLTPGKYQVGIHAIAGASLEGIELAVLFRPIELMSEEKPFNGYITPGESRLLSFDVQVKSIFGIGLRMNKETVKAMLYDSNGKEITQGKQQFLTLDKGRYYLWLRVPVASEGTECTVYLFGQKPPPNEPPERLVKWIISGAQGPRPELEVPADEDENQANQRPSWMRSIPEDSVNQESDVEGSQEGESGDEQEETDGEDSENEE